MEQHVSTRLEDSNVSVLRDILEELVPKIEMIVSVTPV
jgi:hypothetical protein